MEKRALLEDLLDKKQCSNLSTFLDGINSLVNQSVLSTSSIVSDFLDTEFLDEIKRLSLTEDVSFFFGKTMRDIKCIVKDDSSREHTFFMHCKDNRKIAIVATAVPHSSYKDRVYTSFEDAIEVFREYVNSLSRYFYELERIDNLCCVVDPVKPTSKDDYRKILLDNRVWLHIEISADGSATNIHLIGHSETLQEKLQSGLMQWDHDKDIVENVMIMFDLESFPQTTGVGDYNTSEVQEELVCSICLCSELPGVNAVPQPLCSSAKCGVYFHRECLFQWLMASSGDRAPVFGVASGTCPACCQTISCTERDN